jgi:hypothetical protein
MSATMKATPWNAEPGRVGRDDERADLRPALVVGPGSGGDHVCARLPGVGDEPLRPIERPGAAVRAVLETRGRPRAAGVAPRARLGEAVGADDLAAGHRDQPALLLLVAAGQVERAAPEARVGGHDQPERAPHPADLLDRDGVREGVHARPALVLGDRDAEPAELADAAHDLGRESPLAFVLIDDRRDLGGHELADRVAEQGVLGPEVVVHRPEPTIARRRRGP